VLELAAAVEPDVLVSDVEGIVVGIKRCSCWSRGYGVVVGYIPTSSRRHGKSWKDRASPTWISHGIQLIMLTFRTPLFILGLEIYRMGKHCEDQRLL
jgi:hypothetical protein